MMRGCEAAAPLSLSVVKASTAMPEVIGWFAWVVKMGVDLTAQFADDESVTSKRQTLPSTSPA